MTEKRFTLAYEKGNWWAVKDGDITLWKEETIALLNSLNDENEQLKQQCKEGRNDWKITASEVILEKQELLKKNLELQGELDYYKTKCASLEVGMFNLDRENSLLEKSKMDIANSLGECIDKNEELSKENEQLKAQLYCDSDEGVCIICKHHYLEKGNIFYISKCEKGHEECSKEDLRHCKDFEIKELQE